MAFLPAPKLASYRPLPQRARLSERTMSDVVQFELGPLSIAVGPTRRGRTTLSVSAFNQQMGTFTTALEPELETLLAAETEQQALFAIFKDHCAPLLRERALQGPVNTEALCLRLAHPCDNPQCDVMHELLCMNSANSVLANAQPLAPGAGTPFTVVDEHGQPLGAMQFLDEADTERLLLQHVAPALVEMAHFFSPACMESALEAWQPPSPSDQDIVTYFGFFSGSPDPIYGIFQYINPLLLSIWMERINAYIDTPGHDTKAAAHAAWFAILAKLHILPDNHLAAAAANPTPSLASMASPSGSRRLH